MTEHVSESLDGRRVLVTGASSGIGEATVRLLRNQGARVAALARTQERLARLSSDGEVIPIIADLGETAEVESAVDRAADALGGLDALVNNAGSSLLGPVTNGSLDDWQTMVNVNLLGLLAATRAAIPHLRQSESGPAIVNVGSMAARRIASPAQGVYAGTKHAVHAMSEALRAELYPDQIRVTVIAPGYVRTNLGEGIEDPVVRERMREGQVEQSLGPEDVAAQIAYVLRAPSNVSFVEIALISTRQRLA